MTPELCAHFLITVHLKDECFTFFLWKYISKYKTFTACRLNSTACEEHTTQFQDNYMLYIFAVCFQHHYTNKHVHKKKHIQK